MLLGGVYLAVVSLETNVVDLGGVSPKVIREEESQVGDILELGDLGLVLQSTHGVLVKIPLLRGCRALNGVEIQVISVDKSRSHPNGNPVSPLSPLRRFREGSGGEWSQYAFIDFGLAPSAPPITAMPLMVMAPVNLVIGGG